MKVDFDFYRRIPKDLTEATAHGSYVSICALGYHYHHYYLLLIIDITIIYIVSFYIDSIYG